MSGSAFETGNGMLYGIKGFSPLNASRSNKNYLFAFIANHLIYYPTPISLTYAWSFGFLAGMCLLTQMISGIFLAMHYTPQVDLAFTSVEYIMRDVPNGWLLRYIHANGASMFFIVVYSHIFRGLYYGSYMKPRELLWCSGVILFVLMMATAFTGYVLPWGQMSFWGATVITSMFTVIPIAGKAIVEWLWGGFTVNNPTLNRFFSIHFILPFLIAGVTLIHLALLHKDGSNNPIGSDAGIDDVPFYPYFVSKDMFAFFCFLFFFGTFVFYFPNVLNHPDNCIPADPMETPAHVVPEWYFLPFYAILRSIPNKAGGIAAMGGAIAVLLLIPFNNTSDIRNTTYRPIFKVCYWLLIASWFVLTWIGQCPVEDIFAFVGQICTVYYYGFFIVLVPAVGKIESALAHYKVSYVPDLVDEQHDKFFVYLGVSFFAVLTLYFSLLFFSAGSAYLEWLEFIAFRIVALAMILSLSIYLSKFEFVKNVKLESEIFELGPKNNSLFVTSLRKYHIHILIMAIVFLTINMGGFIDNNFVNTLLVAISVILSVLYTIQFWVYTKAYLTKPR